MNGVQGSMGALHRDVVQGTTLFGVVAVYVFGAATMHAQTAGGGRTPPAPRTPPRTAPAPRPAEANVYYVPGLVDGLFTPGVRAYTLPPGAYSFDGNSMTPLAPLPPLAGYLDRPFGETPFASPRVISHDDLTGKYSSLTTAAGAATIVSMEDARAAEAIATELYRSSNGVYTIDRSALQIGRTLDAIRHRDFSRLQAQQLQQEIDRASSTMNRLFASSTGVIPAASWNEQDKADSLYRRARQAITAESYRQAAELFRRIRNDFPSSTYTPDAPYWEAFALARLGGDNELRQAQQALEWQLARHPRAATRSDAPSLSARIESQLARRGDVGATSNLFETANRVATNGCPSDDERIDALNAVTRMDKNAAMPIIRKVLARRESCTQNLRRTAVWIVGMLKMQDAPEILMNVAKSDPDRDVREQAIFWMANVPTDATTAMLVDLVKSEAEVELRRRAVYSLSRSNATRAEATLREVALDSKAPIDLRTDALQWLVANTKSDMLPLLRDMYSGSNDVQFRQRLLTLIAQRGEASRDFLLSVAMDEKENVVTRVGVVGMLHGAGVTAAQLGSIYDRTAHTQVKMRAITSLAALKDGAGVDKLVDIARNEKDAQLRKGAVSYLSNTRDPRALQLLQEIIDR